MAMQIVNVVGAALVLAAFICLQLKALTRESRTFNLLNLAGSFCLGVVAVYDMRIGWIALEGAWFAFSLRSLVRRPPGKPLPAWWPPAGNYFSNWPIPGAEWPPAEHYFSALWPVPGAELQAPATSAPDRLECNEWAACQNCGARFLGKVVYLRMAGPFDCLDCLAAVYNAKGRVPAG